LVSLACSFNLKGVVELKKTNVLVMGGDARYIEVIRQLSRHDIMVYIVGFNQLEWKEPHIIPLSFKNIDFSTMDAILLPVTGVNESGIVPTVYSDEDPIFLSEEIIAKTPRHCQLYTGTANDFLEQIAHSQNRNVIPLFARDDIAILNSVPTAEGALQLAMEHTNFTIHRSNVIVLGFGRVGITVARLFAAVGAQVTVAVRNPADQARISEMGLTSAPIDQLSTELKDRDICINTIPHEVLSSPVLKHVAKTTVIIDLASAPGGTNFELAETKGIQAIHALGLPGKVAPQSAGSIIAHVFITLLKVNEPAD